MDAVGAHYRDSYEIEDDEVIALLDAHFLAAFASTHWGEQAPLRS